MRGSWFCSMVLLLALPSGGCTRDCPVGVPLADASRDADSTTDAAGTDAVAPRPGWAISIGGEGVDEIWSVIPDRAGDLVISGRFSDTARFGKFTLTGSGMTSFVAKLDPNGTVLWVTPLAGAPQTTRLEWDGLAVDRNGNIYFAGELWGGASLGGTTLSSTGAEDIYVVKLDPNGNILRAISAGGPGTDAACAIAVGPDDNLTLGGRFSGTVRFGTEELSAKGLSDGLVARLDAEDLRFLRAVQAGSEDASTQDGVSALVLDAAGNTYITGSTGPSSTFGVHYLGGTAGERSVFAAKLDPAGTFLWVGRPALTMYGTDIVLDGLGNLFVASIFRYPDQPVLYSNASTRVSRGSTQHSVQAWDTPLSAPIVHGNKLLADGQGGATLAGHFTGTLHLKENCSLTANKPNLNQTEMNAFLARLDTDGVVVACDQITTTGWTTAAGLARDAKGSLYVAGAFHGSADFGGRTLTSTGPTYGDGFLWKLELEQ